MAYQKRDDIAMPAYLLVYAWKVVQIQTIGIIYVLYRHNGKENGNYPLLGLIWELPSEQVMYCCLSLELR